VLIIECGYCSVESFLVCELRIAVLPFLALFPRSSILMASKNWSSICFDCGIVADAQILDKKDSVTAHWINGIEIVYISVQTCCDQSCALPGH
jgi:hypothetical protein